MKRSRDLAFTLAVVLCLGLIAWSFYDSHFAPKFIGPMPYEAQDDYDDGPPIAHHAR